MANQRVETLDDLKDLLTERCRARTRHLSQQRDAPRAETGGGSS